MSSVHLSCWEIARLKPFGHRFGWQQAEKEVRARARLEAANTTGVGAPPEFVLCEPKDVATWQTH